MFLTEERRMRIAFNTMLTSNTCARDTFSRTIVWYPLAANTTKMFLEQRCYAKRLSRGTKEFRETPAFFFSFFPRPETGCVFSQAAGKARAKCLLSTCGVGGKRLRFRKRRRMKKWMKSLQASRGSFSAVSTPPIARIGAFFNIFEIYKMYRLLHRSDVKISAKSRPVFSKI